MVVNAASGSFTYTPTAAARHAAAKEGADAADLTDSFAMTLTDGHGGTASALVTVVISPKNAAPTATTTVGTPDPSTGVVTGTVAGADAG